MNALFSYEDDPDLPGWKRWQLGDETRFNAFLGAIHVRVEDGIARVRMTPRRAHSNLRDHMHGGALLGFIDCALFAGARGLGVLQAGGAVTLDLATQFIGGAALDRPVEARVELLRETGRLLFLRGLIVQDDVPTVASFTATLRKSTPPAAIA
ncbi:MULTISPECIES: PaaI family thioesterase [unclassified Sphingomonas]|uniref:PaaI family thioesterase n=1 Tax=unclassified Sphingomonas TaxID=196159 RepID=UPI000E10AFB2|nr:MULTISPECIES: PaaI family thioesterase [unclassified Sphingomonas]AXJ97037.1 PaaI family thioesterase [Sphingomonas sp. FARSPH]